MTLTLQHMLSRNRSQGPNIPSISSPGLHTYNLDTTTSLAPFARTWFHGTKAYLNPWHLVVPGDSSIFCQRKNARYIFLTGTLDAMICNAKYNNLQCFNFKGIFQKGSDGYIWRYDQMWDIAKCVHHQQIFPLLQKAGERTRIVEYDEQISTLTQHPKLQCPDFLSVRLEWSITDSRGNDSDWRGNKYGAIQYSLRFIRRFQSGI